MRDRREDIEERKKGIDERKTRTKRLEEEKG
jgi:hypothetical protein